MWKIGAHLTIVRLGPLSTNVDLDIADDKYRIISSLLGLYKNNDRARSTRLPFLRRSRRESLSRFNRHLSIVLKPACHYFGHWGGTEGNDLSDLLFHSLKIIPCSKQWKGTLTGVELLFLPESLLYDVWNDSRLSKLLSVASLGFKWQTCHYFVHANALQKYMWLKPVLPGSKSKQNYVLKYRGKTTMADQSKVKQHQGEWLSVWELGSPGGRILSHKSDDGARRTF